MSRRWWGRRGRRRRTARLRRPTARRRLRRRAQRSPPDCVTRQGRAARGHGKRPRPIGTFVNTGSVEGFVAEAFQPAGLGWGTHERGFPPNGHRHPDGCRAAIYRDPPGLLTKAHTWTPAAGPQYGSLVTHKKAISIADCYTVGTGDAPEFRPTRHHAHHPFNDAVPSLHETLGSGRVQGEAVNLDEHWTPIATSWPQFDENIDESDPWQFRNVLAS
jgi:homospermidine synthase